MVFNCFTPGTEYHPHYNPVGERYLYLPLIGITGFIAFTLQKYHQQKMVGIVLVLCIFALSARTIIRNRDWRNETTLFSSVAQYPSGPRTHYNYANVLREQGNLKEAVNEYQIAVAKAPRFVQAWSNLGTLEEKLGNYQEALIAFNRALAIQPNSPQVHNGIGIVFGKMNQGELAVKEFQTAILLKPDYSEAHFNLGLIYLKLNQTDYAISELQTAIVLNPDFIAAYDRLGSIYLSLGNLNDLALLLQRETQIFPDRIEPYQDLGKTYLQLGQVLPAIDTFNIVLYKNPNYAPALNNLAWIYATCSTGSIRNGAKAVELALQAAKLTQYSDAGTLDTLAAAYAESGEFKQAINFEKQAIKLTPKTMQKDYLTRLQLYQKNQTYREP
jgi:tetratricopeptide (TPR) repeat protein